MLDEQGGIVPPTGGGSAINANEDSDAVVRPLEGLIPEPWDLLILPLAAIVVAFVVHVVIELSLRAATKRGRGAYWRPMVARTVRPLFFVLLLLAFSFVRPAVGLEEVFDERARHLLSVLLIASITWLIVAAINSFDDVILSWHDVSATDNRHARRVHTQTRVLSRTATIIVGMLGIAAIIMTFPNVRQIGTSIFASAGVAGLVIGLAAQPTVASIIAGLQIALTQTLNIDDVVIVQGEWGRIEEINSSYVVVRIWDQRRLVVPIRWFIDNPFENWTRTTSELLGTIFVYADHTLPAQELREELKRICESCEEWDGRVCVLQVTDTTERTVQFRALVSARDSPTLWDLRVRVREKLIEYLQQEHPGSLPRVRASLDAPHDRPDAADG